MLSMKSGVEVAESRYHMAGISKFCPKKTRPFCFLNKFKFDWITSKFSILCLAFVICNLKITIFCHYLLTLYDRIKKASFIFGHNYVILSIVFAEKRPNSWAKSKFSQHCHTIAWFAKFCLKWLFRHKFPQLRTTPSLSKDQ